jgi:hypothetical protein
MKNKNIVAVTNLIRTLSVESLKNPEVVANLVRAFGIVQWGPPVFGTEEMFKNSSVEMAGIYQDPSQIADALIYLSDYKIHSFIEVGVFQGGNLIFMAEYLKRFNPGIGCLGIDPTDYLNPEIRDIIDHEPWLSYKKVTSDALAGQEFDLAFLDGEHTKEWIEKDYKNVGQYAKICMLHDIQGPICPDVVAFWKGLKAKYPDNETKEFLRCGSPGPTKGIGVIHREKKSKKA